MESCGGATAYGIAAHSNSAASPQAQTLAWMARPAPAVAMAERTTPICAPLTLETGILRGQTTRSGVRPAAVLVALAVLAVPEVLAVLAVLAAWVVPVEAQEQRGWAAPR